jgi:RNA polymerase sigma factor (sigma-70 family)
MERGEVGRVDDSFEVFFTSQMLPAVRLAFLLIGRSDLAEEIAQEAFASVYRRWEEIEQPKAYLRVAVVNLCRSHQRRAILERRARRSFAPPLLSEEPDRSIWEDVRRLRARDREVIVLRFYEDLTLEQIADALELPLNTVKTRLRRALERLRRSIS